jgi:hypothetical protein
VFGNLAVREGTAKGVSSSSSSLLVESDSSDSASAHGCFQVLSHTLLSLVGSHRETRVAGSSEVSVHTSLGRDRLGLYQEFKIVTILVDLPHDQGSHPVQNQTSKLAIRAAIASACCPETNDREGDQIPRRGKEGASSAGCRCIGREPTGNCAGHSQHNANLSNYYAVGNGALSTTRVGRWCDIWGGLGHGRVRQLQNSNQDDADTAADTRGTIS